MKKSAENKRVLVVAYFFPPAGGVASAASQRTLKLVRYLPEYGWIPEILTAREKSYERYIAMDSTLMEKVPENFIIHRSSVINPMSRFLRLRRKLLDHISGIWRKLTTTQLKSDPAKPHAQAKEKDRIGKYQKLKNFITDFFNIPDEQSGWLLPAIRKGRKVMRNSKFDLIFATGKPWTDLMIGLILSLMTKRPLVIEFQDPWTTNPFNQEHSFLRTWIEIKLEKIAVTRSVRVVTTTTELMDEFCERFPDEPCNKFVCLPNCYDPVDIPENSADYSRSDIFTVLHLGYIYIKRNPRNFLLGIKIAIDRGWIEQDKFKFVQIGTVDSDFDLENFITSHGLDQVVELRGQKLLKESLSSLWEAQCLLLLQPGTSTQMPSKLFEYITTGQPILTISPINSAVWKFAEQNDIGAKPIQDNPEDIANSLKILYSSWETDDTTRHKSADLIDTYSAKNVARKLAAHMDSSF